jgi:DNA-binding NtrC family response regulator
MEILLVERDALVRDHIKVGLQQFPEIHVTLGSGFRGINELRSQTFDCVFLGVDPRDQESVSLLQHLRSFDKHTEVVVLTSSRYVKDMAADKARYDVHTFLQTPIHPKELFDFIGRFLERHTSRSGVVRRSSAKGPARGQVPSN